MDLELLDRNIRKKCLEYEISLSQLEKELHFGAGSIGKWRQSAPSIEKVATVAEYFRMTLDELCGVEAAKKNFTFMQSLIQKTEEESIYWRVCSLFEVPQLSLYNASNPAELPEVYVASLPYHGSEAKLYLVHSPNTTALFICLFNKNCIKQDENISQLEKLWDVIQECEQKLQEQINEFKQDFME